MVKILNNVKKITVETIHIMEEIEEVQDESNKREMENNILKGHIDGEIDIS